MTKCLNCGRKANISLNEAGDFCSKKCAGEYKYNYDSEKLELGRKAIIEKLFNCPVCGKPLKQVNQYEWKPSCNHLGKVRVSVG